jgi:hypothetical protein
MPDRGPAKRKKERSAPSAQRSRALSSDSPLSRLATLCQPFNEPSADAQPSPVFIAMLCEQFAEALADDKLESAMAMLAGCPQLALLPCRKALYSALHWSCASVRLAPATRALLELGCDPWGYPARNDSADASNTPLRWAVSSGNLESLRALLHAGALPTLGDLHEACRNAQGACAMAILSSAPLLDPFEPIGPHGAHCYSALEEAARSLRNPINDYRLQVDQALAAFEQAALMSSIGHAPADGKDGRRL